MNYTCNELAHVTVNLTRGTEARGDSQLLKLWEFAKMERDLGTVLRSRQRIFKTNSFQLWQLHRFHYNHASSLINHSKISSLQAVDGGYESTSSLRAMC